MYKISFIYFCKKKKKNASQTVYSYKFPLVVAESCYESENLDLDGDNDDE